MGSPSVQFLWEKYEKAVTENFKSFNGPKWAFMDSGTGLTERDTKNQLRNKEPTVS